MSRRRRLKKLTEMVLERHQPDPVPGLYVEIATGPRLPPANPSAAFFDGAEQHRDARADIERLHRALERMGPMPIAPRSIFCARDVRDQLIAKGARPEVFADQTGLEPEKAETRMDTQIERRTDPPPSLPQIPEIPDFDPPNGYPRRGRTETGDPIREEGAATPGAEHRLGCIESLRQAMRKTGLASLYGEEELAATADAYIQGTLAALAMYKAPPGQRPADLTDETLDDALVGAELSAKLLNDRVFELESFNRKFEADLYEALGISDPVENNRYLDLVTIARRVREERDRLMGDACGVTTHGEAGARRREHAPSVTRGAFPICRGWVPYTEEPVHLAGDIVRTFGSSKVMRVVALGRTPGMVWVTSDDSEATVEMVSTLEVWTGCSVGGCPCGGVDWEAAVHHSTPERTERTHRGIVPAGTR